MSKAKATATKKPAKVGKVEEAQPTNVVQLNAATAGAPPSDPPQSKLHAKVIAYCDRIREATTTELHALAVECLKHGAPVALGGHGDLRPLLALQNNAPKSLRIVALATWAVAFAPIVWGKRDAQDRCDGIKQAKEGDKGFKEWNLADAEKTPFYEAKEKVTKATEFLDIIKKLEADNKAIDKCLADTKIIRKNGETDEQLMAKKVSNIEDIAYFMRKKVA